MLRALLGILLCSFSSAVTLPSESQNYVQSVRIVAVSTTPAAGGLPSENKTYIMDVKAFGLILSTSVIYSNASNTFTSSQTIRDGTAGGLLVSGDSVTANAFFGNGSALSGIPSTASVNALISIKASSGTNSDISSLNGAGNSVTISTSLTVTSSVTFQGTTLQLAAGTTVQVAGVTVSSAGSTYPYVTITSTGPSLKIGYSRQAWTPGYCVTVDTMAASDIFGALITTTSLNAGVQFASITVPSGAMALPGMGVHFICAGATGSAGSGGQIYGNLVVNGTVVGNTSPSFSSQANKSWRIEGDLVYFQRNMENYAFSFLYSGAGSALMSDSKNNNQPLANTSNDIILGCYLKDNFTSGSNNFGFFRVCYY